jgi:hypothetical protein
MVTRAKATCDQSTLPSLVEGISLSREPPSALFESYIIEVDKNIKYIQTRMQQGKPRNKKAKWTATYRFKEKFCGKTTMPLVIMHLVIYLYIYALKHIWDND